jgi:hypothetical protein
MGGPLETLNRLLASSQLPQAAGERLTGSPGGEQGLSFFELLEACPKRAHSRSAWLEREPDGPSPATIRSLLEQVRLLLSGKSCPILAITGMLNAGKSSLVTGLLERANRRRVLIGSGNDQGTHRFVLWLPAAWKQQPQQWQLLWDQLVQLFGYQPEWLSSDPQQAHAQYNGWLLAGYQPLANSVGSAALGPAELPVAWEVPLVALDRELDRWNLGLLDCPDGQSGLRPGVDPPSADRSGLSGAASQPPQDFAGSRLSEPTSFSEQSQCIAESRQQLMCRAARLCSAALSVVSAESLHDQAVNTLLEQLADAMPGIQRWLAINQVKRKYSAEQIADDVLPLVTAHRLSGVYMAYHYLGPQLRERLVARYPGQSDATDGSPQAVFFRVIPGPVSTPPEPIDGDRFLTDLAGSLSESELVYDQRRSLTERLRREIDNGYLAIQTDQQRLSEQCQELVCAVADTVHELATGREHASSKTELRLEISPQVQSELIKSLHRTAPAWARPSLMLDKQLQQVKQWLHQPFANLQLLRRIKDRCSQATEQVLDRFRRREGAQAVPAERLLEVLQRHDRSAWLGQVEPKALLSAVEQALQRWRQEGLVELDPGVLDQLTAELWMKMPWRARAWRVLAPAGTILGPILAVTLLPLDFGGSAILIYASLPELLAAAGVGSLAAGLQSSPASSLSLQTAAWQQASDLLALLCDAFGLERPTAEQLANWNESHAAGKLTLSRLPVQPSHLAGELSVRATLQPAFTARLDQLLAEIVEEVRR